MKGIQITQYLKGPQDLQVTTLPDPIPKPNEYLIEVHAVATNFFDILQIQGKYQSQPPFPWVAGFEFAGVVLATPRGIAKPAFAIGTAVFGAAQGAYATRVCAAESVVRRVPAGWTASAAAGLFVTAPTSYAALVLRAGVKRGDWVLVHAAAGGVGLAAVQVAKAMGATVVATASTERKRAVARSFGADYVIDYRDAGWPDAVKRLTPGGKGVDIVYDPVGLVDKSTRCVAWNGRILVVGFTGGAIEKVPTNKILLKNISLVGIHWGVYGEREPEAVHVVWAGLEKLIADGTFRSSECTDVGGFVGLDSVKDALVALGSRETWGKVVVKVPQEGRTSKI